MKQILLRIIGVIVFLISILLISYPFISNYLMGLNHQSEIVEYEADMANKDEQLLEKERAAANLYNKNLFGTVVITDPFDPNAQIEKSEEYENILNLSNNGVMASIEIPKIKVNLPVYHGTSDVVLHKGVGHLQQTSLPVGGVGTHSVLTGHTGLSAARLFTDLDQLVEDDVFYIKSLGETMAYKIDQIKVVLPNVTDNLRIDASKDYVTLVTCTPYGINSHRLLVRGIRISYEEAEKTTSTISSTNFESTWMKEYKRALISGGIIFLVIIVIYIIIKSILKIHKLKREDTK